MILPAGGRIRRKVMFTCFKTVILTVFVALIFGAGIEEKRLCRFGWLLLLKIHRYYNH